MVQKYGHRANALADEKFVCSVCEESAGFNWSDLHGEGMCNRCGTPYDLKSKPHKANVNESWIPTLKRYWRETGRYMGLGTILVWHDYPECKKGQDAFWQWLDDNPDAAPIENKP